MRRRLTILIAFVALSLSASAPSAHAGWSPAGGALNLDTSKNGYAPSIAIIGATPYVAWREDNGSGAYQVRVARWSGSGWTTVGGALNVDSTKNAYVAGIVDVAGTPHVAWSEDNGSGAYQLRVKRWTGSAWSAVGGALNVDSTKSANEPKIASVDGTPYVVWQEPNAGNVSQARVKRWDGSAWTSAGGSLNADATKAALNPQIADVGGMPYVTWREDANGVGTVYQVHVKSWDGAAWAAVGGVVNVDPTKIAQLPRLSSVNGTPYLAWQEYNASLVDQVHVARWTGSAWSAVGGVLDIDPTKHATDASVVSVGGTPYAVWDDESYGGDQVRVARWTGSAWSLVGDALNPGTTAYGQVARAAVVGGVPYVAWSEPSASVSKVRVSRLAVDVLDQQATATETGAVLTATVRDFGTPLPVAFQYGQGATLDTQTATQTTAGTGTATIAQQIAGLSPATRYAWRTIGLDPFGAIAAGATTSFSTASPAAATPGPAATTPATTPATPDTPRTTIACAAAKPAHGRAKVTCTVRLALARSGAVRVALQRGSVTVASGVGRLSRGSAKLKLSARKRVKPGGYTLIIKAGKATIATSAVRIGR